MNKHIVITGAAGFLGRAVVMAALNDARISQVVACDIAPLDISHPKLTVLICDLNAPQLRHAVALADVVIHLAAMLGGAAEIDPNKAKLINLDATIDLAAACAPKARFVFASSLAVLGATTNSRAPTMIYGCHKAMAEIALETATRRGEIDAISLRPGGIVARADQESGLKSAFLSQVFWALKEGRDITLPVTPEGTTWMSSVRNVADNFMQAAMMLTLPEERSLTLPMTEVQFGALIAAFPDSQSQVSYQPDPDTMRLFGQAKPIAMEDALNAGFTADADLPTLIQNAMTDGELS